jgi:glucokinase
VGADAELLAVGACTFGIPATHGVGLAPAISGWEELALAQEIATAFEGAAVRVATDVKAAAAAEAAAGALQGHDPSIYVNLGTGLAVAIVSGGRVLAGADGAAGEIGYNLLDPADVGRVEHPVLENVVSGIALGSAARRETGAELTAADVFSGEAADARLGSLVSQFVQQLAFHLVNLTVAINPSRIAFGGGLARSWDRLAVPLRRALDAAVPFPPELVLGAYPFDAALVGAVSLAIEAAADGSSVPRHGTVHTSARSHGGRERNRA